MTERDKIESKQQDDAPARDWQPEAIDPKIPHPPKPHTGLALLLQPAPFPVQAKNLLGHTDNGWTSRITGYITRNQAQQMADWCQSLQVQVIITFDPYISPQDDFATQDVDDLCDTNILAILDSDSRTGLQYGRYRYTTIRKEKVALSVIPWDRDPVEFLRSERVKLEPSFNEIRQRVCEVQKEREIIDAQRDQWLHQQAEPLLDDLRELLKDSSLPTDFRKEVESDYELLRRHAYGFSDLIETSDLQELLNVSERRAREFAQQGRLGIAHSRTYVHSKKEAVHFAEIERLPGRPPSKIEGD